MTSAAPVSRRRRPVTGLIRYGVAAGLFALSVVLVLICLAGLGLLVMGFQSWVHPGNVASAWARTLAGVGLMGGSGGAIALRRGRKFVAVVGIVLALICLPFAAAIHASAHAPWFGWAVSGRGG